METFGAANFVKLLSARSSLLLCLCLQSHSRLASLFRIDPAGSNVHTFCSHGVKRSQTTFSAPVASPADRRGAVGSCA